MIPRMPRTPRMPPWPGMGRRRRPPRGPTGLLVLLVVLLAGCQPGGDDGLVPTDHQPDGESVVVAVDRVVDGDTAKVFYEGRSEYVRYIGIDTPETVKPGASVECFGPQASRFNAGWIEDRKVRLVFDRERRDHYGRLLAYIYVGDTLLNAEILRRGYGTALEIPPNTARAAQFRRIEAAASGRRPPTDAPRPASRWFRPISMGSSRPQSF